MSFAQDQLREIAHQLKEGKGVEPVPIRRILAWFGRDRRGRWVVQGIRRVLTEEGLGTSPDFDSVWIDASVDFHLLETTPQSDNKNPTPTQPTLETVSDSPQALFVGGAIPDPTHKVGKFEAARSGVVFVAPDDSVERAATLMMAKSYSQLPVMIGEREVKGMITWETIARQLVFSENSAIVRDCMERHREISADASLFAAIPAIVQSQYVLVRAADNRIAGIITAVDLGVQFQQLAEPFLLLGEIEHQIRRLIENRFTSVELSAVRDPGDSERAIETVADLSLGECIRLLENPENWKKLGLKIDRIEFVKEAHRIRAIRNNVMHFDPDPMKASELLTLREFTGFVSSMSAFLVKPKA